MKMIEILDNSNKIVLTGDDAQEWLNHHERITWNGVSGRYEKLEARIEALEKHILKTDLINFEKTMDMNNRVTAIEQTLASLCKETIK
jgi:hypothetical protein